LQILEEALAPNHPGLCSALSANTGHIALVTAEFPMVSLFELTLVVRAWAAGALWGVSNAHSGSDFCSAQIKK
jgi:hypothetical protein